MKLRQAIQTILYVAIAAFFAFGCGQSNPISSDVQLDDGVVDYTLVPPATRVEPYDPGEEGRQAGTDAGRAELVLTPNIGKVDLSRP